MDIQDLARRHHTHAAHSSSASQPAAETSATDSAEGAAPATSTDTQSGPATTHRLSGGGRFMHMLQAFEDKHPEETKRILNGIADKLRSDAEHAGPWSARLERWADKLEKAADTGDMSNLMPTMQPHAHFGMRAYQKAQEAPDAGELEQVAAAAQGSIPAAANSNAEPQATTAPAAATDTAASSSNAPATPTAAAPASTDAAASSSTPSVTTPIISGTPAATSSSESAQANTPIIPGTPS